MAYKERKAHALASAERDLGGHIIQHGCRMIQKQLNLKEVA